LRPTPKRQSTRIVHRVFAGGGHHTAALATQAIADFIATEASVPVDGIIFPSVQADGDALNVAFFHKAARVEAMNVPEGTEISASTGRWTEEGWVEDYEVLEKVPPLHKEVDKNEHRVRKHGGA
jgi:RES domain